MGAVRRLLLCLIVVTSCGGSDESSGASGGLGEITVFAASSLTESFTQLGEVLEARRPGTTVTFNFASSSELAVQIIEGAPADVYASADPVQMQVVKEEGLAEDPVIFVTNRLVVITPADNPAGIEGIGDLADAGVKVVLAAPEVPAGSYAHQGLRRLGLLDEVEENVVSDEEDVKAVVTKIALGEADAGIAYVTDVTDEVRDQVRAIEFPAGAQIVATYPITVISQAPNSGGARAFFDLVTSEEGTRILRSHGFSIP